jgi:hypothetical protein
MLGTPIKLIKLLTLRGGQVVQAFACFPCRRPLHRFSGEGAKKPLAREVGAHSANSYQEGQIPIRFSSNFSLTLLQHCNRQGIET